MNFRAMEQACRKRGIEVQEYIEEYARHLFEVYERWNNEHGLGPKWYPTLDEYMKAKKEQEDDANV